MVPMVVRLASGCLGGRHRYPERIHAGQDGCRMRMCCLAARPQGSIVDQTRHGTLGHLGHSKKVIHRTEACPCRQMRQNDTRFRKISGTASQASRCPGMSTARSVYMRRYSLLSSADLPSSSAGRSAQACSRVRAASASKSSCTLRAMGLVLRLLLAPWLSLVCLP